MTDRQFTIHDQEPPAGFPSPQRTEFAGESTPYPRTASVISLFEEMVSLAPDRLAITFEDSSLTYGELNRRANVIAHRLIRTGIESEAIVALCSDRSIEMIVGMLGILKAGAAYLPVDATLPKERIRLMIADAQAAVLLTQNKFKSAFTDTGSLQLIDLDQMGLTAGNSDESNPKPAASPTSLAYVMYTSGSTGRPKGVMIEHRSVVRLVRNTNYCRFAPDEVFLQLAPISFDASTFEIWGALLNGAQLVIMPPQPPSLQDIGDEIRANRVTTLWLTAGLFHLFVDQRLEDLRPLRQLLAGGDSLSAPHVRRVLEAFPHIKVINGYGPTENTTFTCCHSMSHGDIVASSVSIGKPVSNTFVYLLDEALRPVAPGEVGEVCAGGDGVARGYLNTPELTAGRFLADPFSSSPEARLYRTGDMARWLGNGTLEFLGRRDQQVKILGHRIELGEIESVLGQHPAIKQVCVVVKNDEGGPKRLIAYYILHSSISIEPNRLKAFLSERLPGYMVPATFQSVANFPLTANGKVDRSAFPDPEQRPEERQNGKGSELEEQIASLWKKVLGTGRVGLDENFFDLGGDSLLLVAIHSQLQKELQREIQVTELFEHATVRSLAHYLSSAKAASPTFAAAQEQARKQREAMSKRRLAKGTNS